MASSKVLAEKYFKNIPEPKNEEGHLTCTDNDTFHKVTATKTMWDKDKNEHRPVRQDYCPGTVFETYKSEMYVMRKEGHHGTGRKSLFNEGF